MSKANRWPIDAPAASEFSRSTGRIVDGGTARRRVGLLMANPAGDPVLSGRRQ